MDKKGKLLQCILMLELNMEYAHLYPLCGSYHLVR